MKFGALREIEWKKIKVAIKGAKATRIGLYGLDG